MKTTLDSRTGITAFSLSVSIGHVNLDKPPFPDLRFYLLSNGNYIRVGRTAYPIPLFTYFIWGKWDMERSDVWRVTLLWPFTQKWLKNTQNIYLRREALRSGHGLWLPLQCSVPCRHVCPTTFALDTRLTERVTESRVRTAPRNSPSSVWT